MASRLTSSHFGLGGGGGGGEGGAAGRRAASNEDYIVVNRDNTWEEVLVDDQGNETVVQRSRELSDATQSGYGKVLDAKKLRDICLAFRDQRRSVLASLETLWPKLQSYADTGLVCCHQQARDQLISLCNQQLKLFVSGSASRMKRSLVKALLGVDTHDCPFSDRVTVRYRASTAQLANTLSRSQHEHEDLRDGADAGRSAFVVLVHFRQDLSEEDLCDTSLHAAVRQHLREVGVAFPLRCRDKEELLQVLGHHGPLEASWEDVRSSTLALVESLEVFLGQVAALDVGLEIIDGPTVKEGDIVATALRKQVDGIIFVLNADESVTWGPVRQAVQYLPSGSVFVICVTAGTEDADALTVARRQAEEMRVLPAERLCCLPSILQRESSVQRSKAQIRHLELELATYLEKHANMRSKELTRIAIGIVDQLREQVERMSSLLVKPQEEIAVLRGELIPKLLALQEKHERKLKEVRLEYSRQRESVRGLVGGFYTALADKVPDMAGQVVVKYQVGVTGASCACMHGWMDGWMD